ncbi:MAG: hypothetical protein ACXVB9_14450 [Bdellovibrionota bacterium]
MKSTLFALGIFLSALSQAAEGPPPRCEKMIGDLKSRCASGADAAKALDVQNHCKLFRESADKLDKNAENVKTECGRAATAATKKSVKKSHGDQSMADGDAAAMATQGQGYMKKCSGEIGKIKDSFQDLSDSATKNGTAVDGLSPGCATAVKNTYASIKTEADEKVEKTGSLQEQYGKGVAAADKISAGNTKNANGMNTAGQGDAKKEQPAGGGGMPKLPEFPPQKKDQSKTPQQMLAEAQKARQQQCQGLINAYSTGVLTCDGQHHCQPEVARVVDVCNAYNACIKALPAVPGDCQGAPPPAQPT